MTKKLDKHLYLNFKCILNAGNQDTKISCFLGYNLDPQLIISMADGPLRSVSLYVSGRDNHFSPSEHH